jgi:ParB-like nuclease family protein
MNVVEVDINSIIVGERRREDFGDMDGLAESIDRHGLFHPIVVDDKRNLIAGERRLRACKSLGWSLIPTRSFRNLTEDERREIELEENIRRKDLSQLEISKNLVALAETAAGVLADSAKTKNTGGRPPKMVVSESAVSGRIGVPRKTINDAQRHVAAVKKYPELATIIPTQKDTITVAKNLDALPEEKRAEARSKLISLDQSTLAILAEKPPMPKPKPRAEKTAGGKWRGHIQDMRQFFTGIKQAGGVLALTGTWTEQEGFNFLAELQDFRSDLDRMINELEEQFDELKQQVG